MFVVLSLSSRKHKFAASMEEISLDLILELSRCLDVGLMLLVVIMLKVR